jgi:outer membrane protein assembly factor BamA
MRKIGAWFGPELTVGTCGLLLLVGSVIVGVLTARPKFCNEPDKTQCSEGHCYRVKDVTITGGDSLIDNQAKSFLAIHPGDVYDARKLEQDAKFLNDLYGYRGYQVKVNTKVNIDENSTHPALVRVEYNMTLSFVSKQCHILISGSPDSKSVSSERTGSAGEVLSYPIIHSTEQVLSRSNLFDLD